MIIYFQQELSSLENLGLQLSLIEEPYFQIVVEFPDRLLLNLQWI